MIIEYLIVLIYAACLLILLIFALTQVYLFHQFKKTRGYFIAARLSPFSCSEELPQVTVQLPIYNEKNVVERLLNKVTQLDYPKNRLDIQVLDDSTDETSILISELIVNYKRQGISIHHLQRKNRIGFKAGALKEGLEAARGEFIAIFDADFIPEKDWLLCSLPYFNRPDIGIVQTRWGHLNTEHSILTKVQAFALDLHFGLEQIGRQAAGVFTNFNGTAGIWRKSCILDAGNWSGKTLTEDLDLSYRAQLKGWRISYRPDIITLAELPETVQSVRSQQFRWNKGGAQNFRELGRTLWENKNLGLKEKIFGTAHLSSSSLFFLVFMILILSVPLLWIKNSHPQWQWIFYLFQGFSLTSLMLLWSYTGAYKYLNTDRTLSWTKAICDFIVFFTLAIGLSANNAKAVLEGHLGIVSPFVRTPKFNSTEKKVSSSNNEKDPSHYSAKQKKSKVLKAGFIDPLIEVLLMAYSLFGLSLAFNVGENVDFGMMPFHLLSAMGFAYLFIKSIFA